MTPIRLRQVSKRFGAVTAVDGVDLDIAAGELFFLLGPSGCGKTTLLRMMAGFTPPSAGAIYFGDREVTHAPANQRNCGMVFQSYALWPHMTVGQNIGFGLDVRKVRGTEKARRIDAALETVQMRAYVHRKPNELSGGQQQRVALARALVIRPTVLLLDEPLSNLDAKLRHDMRGQIKSICKGAQMTAVYVTHDQNEALSMADRIAVMRAGHVVQIGEPPDLYRRPGSRFVADFLGQTNFVPAQMTGREGDQVVLQCPAGELRAASASPDLPTTGNVTCSIRPEAVRLLTDDDGATAGTINRFGAKCVGSTYLGHMTHLELALAEGMTLSVLDLNPHDARAGEVTIAIDPGDVVILED